MPDTGLKIIFAGTPEFAAVHLRALLGSKHQVVAVYTQPDRPAGRGKKLQSSAVKEVAVTANLPIEQPVSLKDAAAQATLQSYNPDIMVVVAYGLLLPKTVLELPRLGCINVHASLLPRWRGAAPIQRAIDAGDSETGVTIMQMDVGLDTGAMLLKRSCSILPTDTAASLHDRLAELGSPALLATLDLLARGESQPEAQDGAMATYAHKLSKEEALLDWSQDAAALARRVRAFNPFPVAYTLSQNENLRIYAAESAQQAHSAKPGTILNAGPDLTVACGGNSVLRLQSVQLPGKKIASIRDLLNGAAARFAPGTVLGAQ